MRKFDSRHSTSKTMIVVAASLALGTAMMATATLAFARGGSRGHFGGSGRFGGGFDGGHFAGRHFGRGFGGDFGRLYGFGGDGLNDGEDYGYGYSGCYVPTPDGYAWACY